MNSAAQFAVKFWSKARAHMRFVLPAVCFLVLPVALAVGILFAVWRGDGSVCGSETGYDAIDACSRLLTRNPNAVNYNNRAKAYVRKGDYDHAIADYDQVVRLAPNHAATYHDRGDAYYGKGDYDRAISDYDEAIRRDPKYATAYIDRGNAYAGKGDYDRAISDYDQAIRLDPTNVIAYDNRGNAYYSKGDYDRAIGDAKEAIQLEPRFTRAYGTLSRAYEGKGEHDLARDALTSAAVAPINTPVDKNLESWVWLFIFLIWIILLSAYSVSYTNRINALKKVGILPEKLLAADAMRVAQHFIQAALAFFFGALLITLAILYLIYVISS